MYNRKVSRLNSTDNYFRKKIKHYSILINTESIDVQRKNKIKHADFKILFQNKLDIKKMCKKGKNNINRTRKFKNKVTEFKTK